VSIIPENSALPIRQPLETVAAHHGEWQARRDSFLNRETTSFVASQRAAKVRVFTDFCKTTGAR
jgi:hypothetical protein